MTLGWGGRMKIAPEVYAAHRDLSAVSAGFIEYIKNNRRLMQDSGFKAALAGKGLGHLSSHPWPVFIDDRSRERIRTAAVGVFELIKSIPRRFFQSDIDKISRYYGITWHTVKSMLEGVDPIHMDGLLARGDFILSSTGIRCVEYNIQANLGGWELDILEPLYIGRPPVSEFLAEYGIRSRPGRFFPVLFEHLVDTALERFSLKQINIAVVFHRYYDNPRSNAQQHVRQVYQDVLRRKNSNLGGQVLFCDYSRLDAEEEAVYCRDEPVHVLLEMCNVAVPPDIMALANSGKLLILNGPVKRILSNKLSLALLSTHQDDPRLFRDHEREVIRRSIPWTRKIADEWSDYQGERVKLPDFLVSHRDKLVIKASEGIGGKTVFIGRKTSGRRWKRLVADALVRGNWVAQEYVEPSAYLFQSGKRGWKEHLAVWGVFVFGSRYAGAFVRFLPRKGNRGVINSHQGALETIVIEVEESSTGGQRAG